MDLKTNSFIYLHFSAAKKLPNIGVRKKCVSTFTLFLAENSDVIVDVIVVDVIAVVVSFDQLLNGYSTDLGDLNAGREIPDGRPHVAVRNGRHILTKHQSYSRLG